MSPRDTAPIDRCDCVGEMKLGGARYWTTGEQRKLRENYETLGAVGCMALLPGRTLSGIYGQAGAMGLKRGERNYGTAKLPRYRTSPEIDDAIRNTYSQAPEKRAIVELARSLCRPRHWVTRRATQLGLITPRFRQPDWTEAEDELLMSRPGASLTALQRALARIGSRRSETAIDVRLKRLHAATFDPNALTARHVARLMCVDPTVVSKRWIRNGWLRAKPRGTARLPQQGGDEWSITVRDIRRFVLEHAEQVDLRKLHVNRWWFVQLMAGDLSPADLMFVHKESREVEG